MKFFRGTSLEIPYLKFKKQKLGIVSLFFLLFLYVIVFFEGFFAPYDANTSFRTKSYQPPHAIHFFDKDQFIGPFVYEYNMVNPLYKEYKVDRNQVHRIAFIVEGDPYKLFGLIPANIHLFGTIDGAPLFLLGTDQVGRDLFSRIIYGARVSMTIGFIVVFLSLVGGILFGGLSGYVGGLTDWTIMRFVELIILLPTFYLFLFLRTTMPPEIPPSQKFLYITMILSVPGMAASARSIRNWVLSLKNVDFVISAQISGVPDMWIILRHIIPQIRNILILGITLSVPGIIMGEAAISFLNLGITEPDVSWGMLMSNAMNVNILQLYPWILAPAVVIILTVFAFFALGYAIKDSLDPKTIV